MRILAAFLVVTAALSATSGAVFEDQPGGAWRNWAWFRPIDAEPVQESRLVRFRFPFVSYSQAKPGFDDTRIIDESGIEIAFVLQAHTGETSREWRSSRIVEIGYVPGRYTQVEIDTGNDDKLHNSVEVETGEKNFYALVEVALSDDRVEWRIAREKAPLYRFQSDGLQGTQTVPYPESRSRWLRLRISGHPAQFPLTECRTAFTVTEPAELEDIGMEAVPGVHTVAGESRWELRFAEAAPLAGVRFSTPVAEFHRPVVIEAGAEIDALQQVGEDEIYRYRSVNDPELTRSRLSFPFPETRARVWRFRVLNRGDQPLQNLDLYALDIPRWLVFRQEPGHTYRLLYGNARATSSTYDLAIVTPREELDNAALVSVGAERRNPEYVSPEPWTERNPLLLWAALGLSVGVLAWLAFRSLRNAGPGNSGDDSPPE